MPIAVWTVKNAERYLLAHTVKMVCASIAFRATVLMKVVLPDMLEPVIIIPFVLNSRLFGWQGSNKG